MDVEY